MIVPNRMTGLARPREFDEEIVLDAIMDTFWRNGFEGTTAQNLVDATGLGRGSLYAAYTDKDGLFEQALVRYRKRAQAHVDELRGPGKALERLRAMMCNIVDSDLATSDRRGCLATNSAIEMAGRDPRVADLVRVNFSILTRGIEEVIEQGQAAGDIRRDTAPPDLALFLFNAIQGLRVLSKTARPQDAKRLKSIIDQTLKALT